MYHLALIILTLTVLINIFFGLVVLLRVYQKTYGWYFVATVFGIILWAIGDIGLLFARDTDSVHAFALLFYVAPMLTPISIWYFAYSYPDNKPLPKWAILLPILPFFVISAIFIWNFDFFVKSIELTSTLNVVTPQLPGFYLYSAYFSFFFVMAYIAFILKTRQTKGLSRTQVQYIFYGVLFGSFLALLSNLSLPVIGIKDLIWLGPFFSLIFPATATIAIVKHRLFNIKLVLARSLGYILSAASLAVLYGFLTFTLLNLIAFPEASLDTGQQVAYALLAAALAFTFSPVRKFFEKITNKLFYRDAYSPQAFIDELNRSLVSNVSLEHMLKEAGSIIQANLKTEFCIVAVADASGRSRLIGTTEKHFPEEDVTKAKKLLLSIEEPIVVADSMYSSKKLSELSALMFANNVAVMARIGPDGQHGKEPLGYMLLGSKKSGNPFTRGDIEILEIIVNELVIAIQNALRFQEIENFNETLQRKVDEATRQLRQKNERLRVLDQTKDDFISMSSHQLRTPLTSVKGYVSMVLDEDVGKINPLQRKLLNQSFVSAQRMVYLISDLLNVSRLRTGKFEIEPISTNLATVIQGEVEQLQETAQARKLELNFTKPEHFPSYMLDETKLRQVIMNFIDNAIYYTPNGGKIEVALADKPSAIEFTVTDTGIGVANRDKPHMFTKYFRAHNAKVARPDGTGLGLFMAKKVIIAHGGAIIFKSREHKGSTFGFSLPKNALQTPPQPSQHTKKQTK